MTQDLPEAHRLGAVPVFVVVALLPGAGEEISPPDVVGIEAGDLVVRTAPGDKSGRDQAPPCFPELIPGEGQQFGQTFVGVIADAAGIGGGDEHQIEGESLGAGTGGQMTIAQEAMINPAEAARRMPETLGIGQWERFMGIGNQGGARVGAGACRSSIERPWSSGARASTCVPRAWRRRQERSMVSCCVESLKLAISPTTTGSCSSRGSCCGEDLKGAARRCSSVVCSGERSCCVQGLEERFQ